MSVTPDPRKRLCRVLASPTFVNQNKGKYVVAADGTQLLLQTNGIRNLSHNRPLKKALVRKHGRKRGTEIYNEARDRHNAAVAKAAKPAA